MKQLPMGAAAPDFTLQLLNGEEFRLSVQLANGPLVLAFYKASCPTCELTFPYLQRIYSELGNNAKYRIVGISQDDPAETKEFVDRVGVGFEVVIDEHPYSVSSTYGVEFVPTTFLIGKDGKIQLNDYGFSKATLAEIAAPLQLFSSDDGLPATRPG